MTTALFRHVTLAGVAALVAVCPAACTSTSTAPPVTVTVTKSTTSSSATAAAQVEIPDVINQNAEIAREQLEQIGLTNIQLVPANPKYQLVLPRRQLDSRRC
ncbi:hypothetical protein [Mycobacterium botniense]|uniref:PASTA domain-containing protein n=1 Tax=Mycobacterium botniense TaxID=84962 RepID=A0A7I9XXU8_9MYCO|nr:hypothetical protein [Mycobacterium botniense]GFG74616.1 hypothetical protein MBOT_19810 [Mycobacterium botniense]